MGQIRCPETSVMNYHSTLRNIPEERRSQSALNLVRVRGSEIQGVVCGRIGRHMNYVITEDL
jgi:hypothetical protein